MNNVNLVFHEEPVELAFSEEQAEEELEKGYELAAATLNNPDEVERLLQRIEKKLKKISFVGDKLAAIPIMASLVRSYLKKDYTDIPAGSILAIISALLYFVSPIDIIPDSIPFLGYFDDAAVVSACWKLVNSDIEEYEAWRKENGKLLIDP